MLEKIISVIVPVYNSEKYIERCLESIITQTYKNLQIIVVNDGSTDNSKSIVNNYIKKDKRIILLDHEYNKGLYHSRITGIEKASGEYIGFVDSDDYISCDYFRELITEAEKSDSDIVVGKIVHEDESGYRYIHNSYDNYDFGTLTGHKVAEEFWKQEGRLFIWHTIWNKIYKRELWTKALPIIKNQQKHLIMAEDFLFSAILYNFAQKLTSAKYAVYFYYQHSDASTSIDGNINKLRKNINDLGIAFSFVKNFVESGDYSIDIMPNFKRWNDLYHLFWKQNIERAKIDKNNEKELLELLNKNLPDYGTVIKNESYFYEVTTKYDSRYTDIIEKINSDEIKCVSFDIFDTSIVRPLYRPTDVFIFLDKHFAELVPNERRLFSELRIMAEQELRRERIYETSSPCEDVSLDEIYEYIKLLSYIDDNVLTEMKILEKNAELRFCITRSSIKNIYQAARFCGKKIYFTSDMYLDKEFLEKLLKEKGYDYFNDVFVSCEENASKHTGKLYDVLIENCKCKASEIMHIGDNWTSDVESASKKGINSVFFPSPLDCIQYNISDIHTTHSCCAFTEPIGLMVNMEKGKEFLGTRSALALAALKLYDNPFISYNDNSEMNCQPGFLGYYALGMHLLGFVKWLIENAISREYEKVVFISRDGYLPMRAYELIKKHYCFAPDAVYFKTSRKAAMACGTTTPEALLSLYENINGSSCTAWEFAELISPLLSNCSRETMAIEGIDPDKPLGSYSEYCTLVKKISECFFNHIMAEEYNKVVANYFLNNFNGKTVCVDIGYSGRTQEMIFRVCGIKTDAFYVHKNDGNCARRERSSGFSVMSFYDHTPSITGGVRELLFSEYAPSCIGYDISSGEAIPVYEKMEWSYPEYFMISGIQKSALMFIEDFCQFFGDDIEIMDMRNEDISYPYEFILHTLTEVDSKMFDCCLFEDDMWAGGTISLSEYWKECIKYHKIVPYYIHSNNNVKSDNNEDIAYRTYIEKGIINKNIINKAMYWLTVDKNFFKRRFKAHLKGNK